MLEWRNRNLGCASVSITSFCHFLLRHLYLKDACMRCLTITCSDEHQQYSSITLTTIYNVVYNFVLWYCYLFIEYKSIPPHSYESFYVTPWNKLCHHIPYNWKIWRRNKSDKFKVDDTCVNFILSILIFVLVPSFTSPEKWIVEMTYPSHYNSSILVICIWR